MDDIERRITEKYFRNGEGFPQIYPDDQDGEMYGSLLRKGREICASLPRDKVRLYFVDGVSCQTGADQELKVLLVWAGMLSLVFKLAALVTVYAKPIPSHLNTRPSRRQWQDIEQLLDFKLSELRT